MNITITIIRYVSRQADSKTLLGRVDLRSRMSSRSNSMAPCWCSISGQGNPIARTTGTLQPRSPEPGLRHCLELPEPQPHAHLVERTDLNFLLDLEGLTEKRLVGALDSLEALDVEAWQRRLFQEVCRHYRIRPSGVIYDVTNTYLYGRRCPLGKPGHDKEEVKGRPLIQIAWGDAGGGLPLFHKVFDGNVHDARPLQDLVTLFGSYKLRPGLFIYDRGIVSDVTSMISSSALGHFVWGALNQSLKKFWRPWADPPQLLQLPHRHRSATRSFILACGPINWMEFGQVSPLLERAPPTGCPRVAPR